MITYICDNLPSDPVFCLFEYFFFAFLDALLLSFDAIIINNDWCPPPHDLSPLF